MIRILLSLSFVCLFGCTAGNTNSPSALPSGKSAAPETYRVKFATSKGDFVVDINRSWSPRGADRFYELVKNNFYDDARFFRVRPKFVVQWGINKDPKVGMLWRQLQIADDPVVQSNLRGFVSFATGGPNTRTTQVFVNLADNARLDKTGFSPFAKVSEGMEVVDQLYSGYGECAPRGAGPDQGEIEKQGNQYLIDHFPRLDYIKTARVL
jgi:peptidyl-prolyl cis-trans isomerase A (cyclophilin A)